MTSFDWRPIKLAVFDVDGTLYDQAPLRIRMAVRLLTRSAVELSTRDIRVLRRYRRYREDMGPLEYPDFEHLITSRISKELDIPNVLVASITRRWLELEPLKYLTPLPHVAQVFDGMRRKGILLGIFSDYPATGKLAALKLTADYVMTAGEAGMLKPNPKGLLNLMSIAQVRPSETVLIGDRPDRDGLAAERAGVKALIRSSKKNGEKNWITFKTFNDEIFEEFF